VGKLLVFIKAFKDKLFEARIQQQRTKSEFPTLSVKKSDLHPDVPTSSISEKKQPLTPILQSEKLSVQPENKEKIPPTAPKTEKSKQSVDRDPYFIQIGFDFGTSYSKCICRDIMIDNAWVHIPAQSDSNELPFLIPSALVLKDGILKHVEDPNCHYPENGLYHLKLAMEKVAVGQWDDPVLDPYRRALGGVDPNKLTMLIKNCGVYLLAGALGEIRKKIRTRYPQFGLHLNDYLAVNLAVPVSDAERLEVNGLFLEILKDAWTLADHLASYPKLALEELEKILHESKLKSDPYGNEACFIYPEVSANVQGFIRSRVSSSGIYLFSDAGAGSVDQSVFIYGQDTDGIDQLTFLYAKVLPHGSSQIEKEAAKVGIMDYQSLEIWREKKERGATDKELREARNIILNHLSNGTEGTLANSKRKLYNKNQLNDIRIFFGGGGHCEHPFEKGVMQPFSGQLFSPSIHPPIIGLPLPNDLELNDNESNWMHRLYVAYGLSFEKSQLAKFIYPKEVEYPDAEKIYQFPGIRRCRFCGNPAMPGFDTCFNCR
jgi:hypothetical protein